MTARSLSSTLGMLLLAGVTMAQGPEPPGGGAPVLRVVAGGPTAFVTSLAFSPDGNTLYSAGFDKVVRVWTLDADKHWLPSSTSYRVPIGAGPDGIINAIAVSADGTWLAAAGLGAKRGVGSFHEVGWVVPRTGMTAQMRQDEGSVYVFNTRTGAVRTLRGHTGPVLSLAFDPAAGPGPMLASCAREPDERGTSSGATVRLWDLSRAAGQEQVAVRKDLPDPVHVGKTPAESRVTRPGLAVYPGGSFVAIACEDGFFRLWDVKRNVLFDKQRDGRFNTAVVYRPEEGRFLSTSLRGSLGHLQAWYFAEDSSPWPHPERQLDLASEEIPRALALFSGNADAHLDHAALVLRAPKRDNEFSFHLVNLRNFREARDPIVLWKGPGNEPVVAAAPRGRYLAVAGNGDNTILVFAIADLLGGKPRPKVLHSDGANMRYVGFVTGGKDKPGLLLSEQESATDGPSRPREPVRGDLIFDFAGRSLTTDAEGCKLDAPGMRGWDVKTEVGQTQVFHVTQNQRPVGRDIELRPGQEVTAYALLPASPAPLRTPLLAVGMIDAGEIVLALYDVTTGQQVRQCTGPVGPIHWLAFSGDGRLLAAASADQTVCLWSLTSLTDILGKHGQLRGVLVKDDGDGRAVIAEADPRVPQLRPGDAVEGLVSDGKLSRTPSARDFYRAVWEIAPARQKTATVRVAGRDVAVPVSQGVDERKPLLSLVITAEDHKGQRDWIGWSPVGPYDSSNRQAERLIGWHVNTGETTRPPVRFALADQFRKDNYKPGILKKLVDYGNPGQAIEAWRPDGEGPPADPTMTFGLAEAGVVVPPDRPRHFHIGQTDVRLTLALDDFPTDKVASVEWQAAGTQGRMAAVGDNRWSADLSRFDWKRGEQMITVRLHTAAPHARDYTGELTVRYQPPAPQIDGPKQRAVATDQDHYTLELQVTPAPGQTVHLTVRQKPGPVLLNERNIRTAREFKKEVALAAGDNLIQIVAENQDAPAGPGGDLERTPLDVQVKYKVPRPQIALNRIVLLDGSAQRVNPDTPDTALVVDVPAFRVEGEIAALAPLTSAAWAEGDGKAEPLTGFDAAKPSPRLAINQQVTLREPGSRKLRFLARVAQADKDEERYFTVEYRPGLPTAILAAPDSGQSFYEGEDPATVGVEVLLHWPQDPRPCKAQLVVNGKDHGAPVAVAAGARSIKADAPLQPGDNRIEVRLVNDWQKQPAVAGPAIVSYRRPPRIADLEAGTPTDKPPRVEMVARIESPNDLPLDRAELTVAPERTDGLRVTGDAVKRVVVPVADMKSEKGDKLTVWTIRVPVPLDEGTNAIRIVAFNKDGQSRKPATTKVQYTKPPPPRPEAQFFEPRDDTSVDLPDYTVEFAVRSESPLTKVELRRGSDEVLFSAPPLGQALQYHGKVPVKLKRGENRLCIVSANADGGETGTNYVIVNYHYRPIVSLHIDGLEVGGKPVAPTGPPPSGGGLPFAKVPTGRVSLVGHMTWDREHDVAVAGLMRLDVTVNGYHQLPALPEPARGGQRRRDFKIVVFLTQTQNTIELLPPSSDPPFAVAAGSTGRCEVPCAAPEKVRRRLLHLLVIDLDQDTKAAAKSALAAIHGSDLNGSAFAVPYCTDGGQLYGPLAGGEVTREAVNGQLDLMQRTLQVRAADGALNDVVMIYYRGGMVTRDGAQFFHSSISRRAAEPRPTTLIPCERLARFFGDSPGAQVVFFDVTAARGEQASVPDGSLDVLAGGNEPHVAIMRYTWTGAPDKQPPGARILHKLGPAMADARTLEQVVDKLAEDFKLADKQPWPSKSYPQTLFDDRVAPDLRSMLLGALRAP
jgi:WD40 repeat protein